MDKSQHKANRTKTQKVIRSKVTYILMAAIIVPFVTLLAAGLLLRHKSNVQNAKSSNEQSLTDHEYASLGQECQDALVNLNLKIKETSERIKSTYDSSKVEVDRLKAEAASVQAERQRAYDYSYAQWKSAEDDWVKEQTQEDMYRITDEQVRAKKDYETKQIAVLQASKETLSEYKVTEDKLLDDANKMTLCLAVTGKKQAISSVELADFNLVISRSILN